MQFLSRVSCNSKIACVNQVRFCRRDVARVSNMFETWCNFSTTKVASSCRDKNRLCKRALRLLLSDKEEKINHQGRIKDLKVSAVLLSKRNFRVDKPYTPTRVVWKLVNTNPGLKVNQGINSWSKNCFPLSMWCAVLDYSNSKWKDKQEISLYSKFLLYPGLA